MIQPDPTTGSGFTSVGERHIHDGFVIKVVEAEFDTPDGDRIKRDVVRHPGAVAIVAVDHGAVVLVRQFRAALGHEMVEIPAGKRDVEAEPPEVTAARELGEEVGLRPRSLKFLIGMHNSVGFCDEYVHIFLATEFDIVPDSRDGAEEQHMQVERWPFDRALEAVHDGTITDAKTQLGILAAARHLVE